MTIKSKRKIIIDLLKFIPKLKYKANENIYVKYQQHDYLFLFLSLISGFFNLIEDCF